MLLLNTGGPLLLVTSSHPHPLVCPLLPGESILCVICVTLAVQARERASLLGT
jgi:hypothetical protein